MTNENPLREYQLMLTRRQLFGRTALGLGTAAMANLFGSELDAANNRGPHGGTHHFPTAKRVIYLFMSGGPDSKLWSQESGFQSPLPAPNLTLFLTASLLVFRVSFQVDGS